MSEKTAVSGDTVYELKQLTVVGWWGVSVELWEWSKWQTWEAIQEKDRFSFIFFFQIALTSSLYFWRPHHNHPDTNQINNNQPTAYKTSQKTHTYKFLQVNHSCFGPRFTQLRLFWIAKTSKVETQLSFWGTTKTKKMFWNQHTIGYKV